MTIAPNAYDEKRDWAGLAGALRSAWIAVEAEHSAEELANGLIAALNQAPGSERIHMLRAALDAAVERETAAGFAVPKAD